MGRSNHPVDLFRNVVFPDDEGDVANDVEIERITTVGYSSYIEQYRRE